MAARADRPRYARVSPMTARLGAAHSDHETAIRAAAEALVLALVAAVRAEATPEASAPERLLSINQAAATLGIGRSALYEAIGRGDVMSIKVGRRRLIAAGAIQQFIRETGDGAAPVTARNRSGY